MSDEKPCVNLVKKFCFIELSNRTVLISTNKHLLNPCSTRFILLYMKYNDISTQLLRFHINKSYIIE